ncbi:MAG: helix-hairpin-helix domain-containing protein [Thermoleophilia bacterium]|nr:helix-hairpin-helix domain-containing protein [Thermoleophilia bacterium]
MTKRISTAFSTFLCLAALFVCAGAPFAAAAPTDEATATDTTATAPPADPSTTEAPVTGLTPEQIAALQSETTTDPTGSSDDKSVFEKASDFVTDHAPFFIIGIVVLAAILAGIFIMRGRSRSRAAAGSAVPGDRGTPASVPSASELRRRKRSSMQRSREEERLRRKAHMEGRRLADPNTPLPLSARLPADQNPALTQTQGYAPDPVEAEKQAARAPAANAVARSGGAIAPPVPATPAPTGAVPAPVAPSQTAPAAGIVTPASEPDTIYTPAAASQAAPAPAQAPPAVQPDQPTRVNELPENMPEPPVEAPGLDARVGEAAAAFAGGAAAGAAVASQEAAQEAPVAADERDAEQRLRAKVAEIRAEQGRGPAPAAPVAPIVPEVASIERDIEEAESIQREIEEADSVPPTPSGLVGVEERLQASSDLRDRTLADAEERLQRIEQRAADAEKRAAFAERLAQLKLDESARERRMDEVMSGIDRAEERAREAEDRAKSAERVASAALEETGGRAPTEGLASPPPVQPSVKPPPAQPWQPPAAPVPEPPRAEPAPPPPAPPVQAAQPVKSPLFGGGLPGGTGSSGSLNLNSATFEELRDADLSVTQATRILAYRERFGGYRSVEDLEKVPGFPAELIESLRGRITV